MDRTLKGTSATIEVTFYLDGVATTPSPNSATIEILREDGTTLVAAGTAATPGGTGEFTFPLTPTHTAILDVLTARWTATLGGQPQTLETMIEIVGGHLFSLADARKLRPLNDTATYVADDLAAARVLAETALEEACGVAFVPRYGRDELDGDGSTELILRPRPTSVLAATVSGSDLTSPQVSELVLYRDGRIYRPGGWPCGRRNVVVKYAHGWEQTPPRVGRACLLLARRWLVESPFDERTTRITSEGGSAVLMMASGGGFDIPEVMAVVERYGMSALVA